MNWYFGALFLEKDIGRRYGNVSLVLFILFFFMNRGVHINKLKFKINIKNNFIILKCVTKNHPLPRINGEFPLN